MQERVSTCLISTTIFALIRYRIYALNRRCLFQILSISSKSFRFLKKKLFSKNLFSLELFRIIIVKSFLFTSDINNSFYYWRVYPSPLFQLFARKIYPPSGQFKIHADVIQDTRLFLFFFFEDENFFCANSSKTMFGNKETKETIKTAAMEVSNGDGEWLRSPSRQKVFNEMNEWREREREKRRIGRRC